MNNNMQCAMAGHHRHPLKMVAVHLGAGNTRDSAKSQEFAKMICEEVMLQQKSCKKIYPSQGNFDACLECHGRNLDIHGDQLTAESAVVQLIQRMEDNQDLNCALGSNLNMQGQVECDAGFMSDRTRIWCGVGAVSGCRNPISLVKSLHDHQSISRPLGLIQPNLLVSSGAKQWMREHCPHLIVADSRLISSKSFSQYQKLKSRYDILVSTVKERDLNQSSHPDNAIMSSPPFIRHPDRLSGGDECVQSVALNSSTNLDHGSYCISAAKRKDLTSSRHKTLTNQVDRSLSNNTQSDGDSEMQLWQNLETVSFDTVGAVAIDCDDNFVSAISSGGLLLKFKGRLGQAAIPGAGCWSEDSVAVTTTGVGEYLTTTTFAKKFFDKIQMIRMLHDLGHIEVGDPNLVISGCVQDCFEELMNESLLSHVPKAERLAGILAVCSLDSKNLPPRIDKSRNIYLSYGHNTNTMCIGYMTCNDVAGHSIMSRQEHEKNIGQPLVETITLSID